VPEVVEILHLIAFADMLLIEDWSLFGVDFTRDLEPWQRAAQIAEYKFKVVPMNHIESRANGIESELGPPRLNALSVRCRQAFPTIAFRSVAGRSTRPQTGNNPAETVGSVLI
jgi:hypothetical protein